MKLLEPSQQPLLVYPYWELWMGRNDTGAKTFARPLIGGMQNRQTAVAVIRPFTTYRFATRCQTTSASPPTDWVATLFKNGSSSATVSGITFGVSPNVNETNAAWSVPVHFDRGDTWELELAGSSLNDPRIICGMDMVGRFQVSGGPTL